MPQIEILSDQNNLVPTKSFPDYAKFPFEFFNPPQSRVFEIYNQDCNLVIAASTSSGKTVMAETILSHEIRVNKGKGMYVAPLKALAQEKIDDWSDPSHHFSDLKLSICTGDYQLTPERKDELDASNLIIMSNEMLNSRLRNIESENGKFLEQLTTVVIDECFPGSAKVRICKNLEVSIKNVVENDNIQFLEAYDENTDTVVQKKILKKITKPFLTKLVAVNHEFGKFTCTEDHKIWTPEGYVKAKDLKEGQEIKWISSTGNNHASKISSIHPFEDDEIDKVYDLEVEDCHNYFVNGVLVSNCHLMNSSSRGSHVEVALMKLSKINPKCRLILLSATVPNSKEIAEWLSYSLNNKKTYLIKSDYRPCPLDIHWSEYFPELNYEKTQDEIIRKAVEIREKHKDDRFLIFAHTKRTGEKAKKAFQDLGYECEFHNGDLPKEKRIPLQEKFKSGNLKTLVSTSTLAWGCYRAGTEVINANYKSVDVAKVKEGDQLISFNLKFSKTRIFDQITTTWEYPKFKYIPATIIKKEIKTIPYALRIIAGNYTVDVTEDHLFLTDMGWVRADKLIIGHSIASPGNFKALSAQMWNRKGIDWQKVLNIEFVIGGDFVELALDGSHTYVGGGLISHNCNLPARRVVIMGVHRGMSLVDTYDIWQEVGRAGRPGYDPKGDAYILVPKDNAQDHIDRINEHQNITSRLLDYVGDQKAGTAHYKTLAFHLISEIHHKIIKNRADVHSWYERSLGHFQSKSLDGDIVDSTIEQLIMCGAMKEEDGLLKATVTGAIASMFYYSPFDIADLRRNFKALFVNKQELNDTVVSICLGNIDSHKVEIASKAEKIDMASYFRNLKELFGEEYVFADGAIKAGYGYYMALTGKINDEANTITPAARMLQWDFPRLGQVLEAIDGMSLKFNKKDFWKKLKIRIAYGVKEELVDLCFLDDIGAVRAKKLFSAGIRNRKQFKDAGKERIAGILNLNVEKVGKMISEI